MTTTLASRLVTTDILQFSLLQTHLYGNFSFIGYQLDRLLRSQDELSERLNARVDQIEERMYLELGSLTVGQQYDPVDQTKGTTQQIIEVEQIIKEQPSPEAPKRLNVQKKHNRESNRQPHFSEISNELQKQLARLNQQLEIESNRIDELESQLSRRHEHQHPKTSKRLESENSPPLSRQFSTNHAKNTADDKRLQMLGSKLESDMSTMQLQITLIQKQLKQLALKKYPDPKGATETANSKVKSDKPKEYYEVKEEIEAEQQNTEGQDYPRKPTLEYIKQLLDDLSFKVGRLDGESVKVFKHINTLNTDRQRHEDELVSIVQKIKKNETAIAGEMKELQQRVELLMTKKALRQEKLLAGRDPNETNSSMLVGDQDQEYAIDVKRLEEIMIELEDLKDEIMGMREKEEHRRQTEVQKDPNCSGTTITAGQAQTKSNFGMLYATVNSMRRDMNSVRYELEMLKSKEEISQQIANECEGRPNQPQRIPDSRYQWKELSIKLQKVRSELLGYIKELDLKLNERDENAEQLRELESSLNENKILLNKKADRQESEKALKKLETRLNNFIKQSIEQEELASTHDARIARQPWFCLSCDNELKNYSGRQGKHLPKDLLPIKKLNTENHMIRRSVKDVEPK